MERFTSLYRRARTVAAAWAWRPPFGVEIFTAVHLRERRVYVLLSDGDTYLQAEAPLACRTRAGVHRRLDELAAVLAEERRLVREPSPAPVPSPALAAAGRAFERSVEELRARGHLLPFGTKGGGLSGPGWEMA
jgi:hypothetical protein